MFFPRHGSWQQFAGLIWSTQRKPISYATLLKVGKTNNCDFTSRSQTKSSHPGVDGVPDDSFWYRNQKPLWHPSRPQWHTVMQPYTHVWDNLKSCEHPSPLSNPLPGGSGVIVRSSRLIQRRHRAPSEWEARAHFIFPRLTVLRLSVSIFKVVRGKQGKGGGSLGEGDDRLSGNSRELGVPLKTLLTGSVASRGKAGGGRKKKQPLSPLCRWAGLSRWASLFLIVIYRLEWYDETLAVQDVHNKVLIRACLAQPEG